MQLLLDQRVVVSRLGIAPARKEVVVVHVGYCPVALEIGRQSAVGYRLG